MNRKENLACIHYVAEKYLADLEACEANALTTERIERGCLQILLLRDRSPEYFCGLNQNGIPVWSYDVKYAKSIDLVQINVWTETLVELGEFVMPIWNGVRH
jgi:hypothetical protein